MDDRTTDLSLHPATVIEATDVAAHSARQVVEATRWLAGEVPSGRYGIGGWETTAALQDATIALAEQAQRLADHTHGQVQILASRLNDVLEADESAAWRYETTLHG